MKQHLYTLLFLLLPLLGMAQPENPVIEEVNGVKYYAHIVQGGNTLYNISVLYKVKAEEIIELNPTVEKGIQIGQRLLIPMAGSSKVVPQQKAPATHIVVKSETLYGISKKYSVTMEDMVKLNPGCENGIAIGQELKIPEYGKMPSETDIKQHQIQVTYSDSTIMYTVLPHETLYSISKRFMVPVEELKAVNGLKSEKIHKGDVIKIPSKKEKVTKVEIRKIEEVRDAKIDEELIFKSKDQYTIIYFLPFNLNGPNDNLKEVSTEFLMGAQIALDSLERLGLDAKVHILDAAVDTTKFKALLESKEVKKADLIIGPFNGKNLDLAADWAKENKVRMISPLFSSTTVLKNNMYVYNAVNSDITLIEGTAKYLAENRAADQILLIKVDSKDNDLYQAFRQTFLKYAASNSKIKLIETTQKDMANYFRKGGNTILVVPSRDKSFSMRFMNELHQLSSKAGSGTLSVFATKDWMNFDDIKGYYKNKYNLHYASPYDFNFSYEASKKLLRKYRVKYNSDLSKYGTQGFDVTMYFVQEFFLEKANTTGVMNKISMENNVSGSGYENKTCFILKFEDYEIKQVAIVNE